MYFWSGVHTGCPLHSTKSIPDKMKRSIIQAIERQNRSKTKSLRVFLLYCFCVVFIATGHSVDDDDTTTVWGVISCIIGLLEE